MKIGDNVVCKANVIWRDLSGKFWPGPKKDEINEIAGLNDNGNLRFDKYDLPYNYAYLRKYFEVVVLPTIEEVEKSLLTIEQPELV